MDIRSTDGTRILFSERELQCKDTGIVKLAQGFASRLIDLREAFGKPMPVNSCCRSKRHNDATEGANPRSFHVFDYPHYPTGGTCAIDIGTRSMSAKDKDKLIRLALSKGWWVGVANTFVHLDRRVDYVPYFKQADRAFTYEGYKGPKYDDVVAGDI